MSYTRQILKYGSATIVGCLAGMSIERNRGFEHSLASLSLVKAAAPLPAEYESKSPGAVGGDQPTMYYQEKSKRIEQIMTHGYPSTDTLRTYDNYVLSYDRRNRTANWVFEHLSPDLMRLASNDKSVDRAKCEFFEDNSVHEFFRASNHDYKGSGFDRGHLAAAGNHKSSQHLVNQTFVLSNISPQVGKGFNRDAWNNLEQYVRYRAMASKNLWVCTGPLYLPKLEIDGKKYIKYQVIGKNHVAVPTHFFKVILTENVDSKLDLECYLMPNQQIDDNLPLQAFQVPIDSVERAAGLLFFHQLPRNAIKQINGNNPFLDKYTKSPKKIYAKK